MTTVAEPLDTRWDQAAAGAAGQPEELLYRSHLLGADRRITNFGGGNTSSKLEQADPLTGETVDVLWVKGSGGDLASMDLDGFATLYLDKLRRLETLYRGADHEDEMVACLPHATFDLNPRAPSIDTPLHAFVDIAHVDHTHPDAIIALACTRDSRELSRAALGDRIGWLAWQRPGFDLGLRLRALVEEQPGLDGAVLQGHGLITWGPSARECYETTIATIQRAIDWLAERDDGTAFGGQRTAALEPAQRHAAAARLMPTIRGRISGDTPKIGHFNDDPAVLDFVNGEALERLAALGTSCPDHFLRTKVRPLVLPATQDDGVADNDLDTALDEFRQAYADYYQRNADADSPRQRDPNPVVYLVPGLGMLTFAANKATARIASEFYVNAINVMRGAESIDEYVGLSEREAFNIEYWQLEEAKLQRMPPPRPLAGRIALITGGAGGIGQATAERLLSAGACVVLTDIDREALAETERVFSARFDADRVRAVTADVIDPDAVNAALASASVAYGGLDILVSNAGIASSAAIEDTDLALWNRNFSILSTGYFLVSQAAFRVLKTQGCGGSLIFIGSKNALVASAGASAYGASKAAATHLARCLALEGAPAGIRVNTVNPDAVLQGSKIWNSEWRRARAATYAIDEDELDAYYRERSLLGRSVLPSDVAEAVYFFASDASAKSTGNMLNVDAGNVSAFTR